LPVGDRITDASLRRQGGAGVEQVEPMMNPLGPSIAAGARRWIGL
jgi:hypothetical protein